MTSSVSGSGFTFSIDSVSGSWGWTVSTSNLLGQSYQVKDITTPYGPFGQSSIPLPEDVVQAMSQSLIDVKNQLKPRLVQISSQTSFSIGLTEGDPTGTVGTVQVRNDGGFGSFLTATATVDVPWLLVEIPEVSGLARGQTATFTFDFVPETMLAAQSPYVGHVRIQDGSDATSYIILTVTAVVLPRPAITVSTQDVAFVWSFSSPSSSIQYVNVTNSGPGTSTLDFSAIKVYSSAWLTLSPETGGPLVSGATQSLTLLVPAQLPLLPLGDHVETVRVSSTNASNSPVDVRVTLSVIP